MPFRILLSLISICLIQSSANAFDWTSGSSLWRSGKALAPGKTAMSLGFDTRSASTLLNSSGESEDLGHRSQQKEKLGDRTITKDFRIRMNYERWTPTWAYGLLPGWTIMARIPFTRIRFDLQQSYSEDSGRGQISKSEMQSFDTNSVGQTPGEPGSYDTTRVGRFQIRSKHQLQQSSPSDWQFTMHETLLFPTAEKIKVDYLVYPEAQPSSFSAGLGVIVQKNIMSKADLIFGTEYLYQFQDSVYGRDINGFPTEEKLERQPGAEVQARLGAKITATQEFNFNAGLVHEQREQSKYLNATTALREVESSEKQSMYLAVNYAPTFKSFRQLSDSKLSANLELESLLQGKNVEDAKTLNLELVYIY